MKVLRILVLAVLPVCLLHAEPPAQVPGEKPPFEDKGREGDSRNLLKNGNFEDGTAHWELLNWEKKTKMEIDPTERFEGKPALRVDNLEGAHSFIRQQFQGKPNTRYELSGYIKTRNVEPAKKGQKSGAILMVGRWGVYTPLMDKTKPWTKVTSEFVTRDDAIIRCGPSLGTDGTFATGTAWFAEVKLIELGGNGQK